MIHEIKKGQFKYIEEPDEAQINWGNNDSPIGLLELGKVYNGKKEVHDWHTKIILDDFPNKRFNSVSFNEV